MKQTVVGVFDRYEAARHAATILQDSGFGPDAVQIAQADEIESGQIDSQASRPAAESGGVMARVRHFFAEVFGQDDGHEHVSEYAEAVRRGGAVVKVDVDEDDEAKIEKARQALEAAGAVNIEERVAAWRNEGWQPATVAPAPLSDSTAPAFDTPAATRPVAASDSTAGDEVIPVIREELAVGKRLVSVGGIRVYATATERAVSESIELREERAKVERHAVDRPATDADLQAFEDRTIEVRETAEHAVVQKSARVVEEVVVGTEVSHRTETIHDTVRETEIEVEPMGSGDAPSLAMPLATSQQPGLRNFDDYEQDYRADYDTQYSALGGAYNDYAPAYRYGHSLSGDPRYVGQSWEELEPQARSDWDQRHPGSAWDKFKGAVRHAWQRIQS